MKIPKQIFALTLLAFACTNTSKETAGSDESDTLNAVDTKSAMDHDAGSGIWAYQFDTVTGDFKTVKLNEVDGDTLSPETVVNIVNKTWPKVQVQLLKISKDTVYISIPESEVLTQQMGTAGADEFMVSTTYSFTELKGIRYVSYSFEVGDHAMPGVYNRDSWGKE